MDSLRVNEKNLLNKITNLELNETKLKQSLEVAKNKIEEFQRFNDVLSQKVKSQANEQIVQSDEETEQDKDHVPLPSFMKILDIEKELEEKTNDDRFVVVESPELACESIRSTDENFIGMVDNKPWVYVNNTDPAAKLMHNMSFK